MQFHIHRPFKVLLDGNFLHACIKNNINIHDRLSTTLSDPQVQLLVPDEVIAELTAIGAPCADALALAPLPLVKTALQSDGRTQL